MSRLPHPLYAPAVLGLGLLAAGCHDRPTPTAPARVVRSAAAVERSDQFLAFYINGGGQALLQATAHVIIKPDGTFVVQTGDVRLTPL